MNSFQYLHFLFYDIGKQTFPEHQVQYSYMKGKDRIFCKRKCTIDLSEKDEFNHRQIFPFEIIIDIDKPDKNTKSFLLSLHSELKLAKVEHTIFFTGSKGYHINIFDLRLLKLSKHDRELYREKVIESYTKEYDKMLLKDSHLIASENTEHWKTGKMKRLLYAYFNERDINSKIQREIIIDI